MPPVTPLYYTKDISLSISLWKQGCVVPLETKRHSYWNRVLTGLQACRSTPRIEIIWSKESSSKRSSCVSSFQKVSLVNRLSCWFSKTPTTPKHHLSEAQLTFTLCKKLCLCTICFFLGTRFLRVWNVYIDIHFYSFVVKLLSVRNQSCLRSLYTEYDSWNIIQMEFRREHLSCAKAMTYLTLSFCWWKWITVCACFGLFVGPRPSCW